MNLMLFNYESEEEHSFNQIRTIEEDGKIMFCATDVARILGYSNPRDAVIKFCKSNGVVIRDVIDSMNRTQKVKFITEGNVYRLISRSQLPSAEKFESWLFDEVVPSIMKKGFYGKIDRTAPFDFVTRYKENHHAIPYDYFSVIDQMYIVMYAELEKVGYSIPDKGAHGKTMMPDISVGRYFAKYLKDIKSEYWDKHRTYKHRFTDGRIADANMYPIEALPTFVRFINERWLYYNAENYFKDKDPLALEYLPKLIESKRKSA